MKRRNFLSALAALLPTSLVAGESSHPGGALDQWIARSASTDVIPPKPSTTTKVMRWACVCLRHGAHWTIGAIQFAFATIGQVRHHLVSVHGHNYAELNGMSKEQLGFLHDSHHTGRSYGRYNIPATPANGVDKLRRRPT